jgi:hypothetical protein
MILFFPLAPLAKRKALMTASVPELVKRILSMKGSLSNINEASSFSFFVGAPKLEPF